ncbi:SCO family protein [Anabaena azotica]|uniref:SCO family protein n=1 Tax=Anabaena azotica FACHB-119 TaxID=947527 RepID=A0ABR8D7P4_9NOST|nr:SCO family protein [Anabaena azotica]MBD2503175.1 SCO family protein [Anabaena azotica FACHB-119]
MRIDSGTVVVDVQAISSEAEVIDFIQLGQGDASFTPCFLDLLEERHPVYAGVDSATVTRIRGSLIQALAYRALPETALPFVLAELESAFDPWLTAVAAAALRKRPEPSAQFVQPLLEAILYIRHRDDLIRLDTYGGYGGNGEPTTALKEILRTFAWLGSCGRSALPRLHELAAELKSENLRSDLNKAIEALETQPLPGTEEADRGLAITRLFQPLPSELTQLRLQDQSGSTFLLPDFFSGQPTVVVFFFTRCGNPAKCPLTISRLGRLQKRLQDMGSQVRTAAITYDPEYDDPRRLTQYARSWGAQVDENHRFLRTLDNHALLRQFFELGVSYGGTSVNQHQLEAFVLNADCSIVGAVRRRRLDASEIIAEIAELMG